MVRQKKEQESLLEWEGVRLMQKFVFWAEVNEEQTYIVVQKLCDFGLTHLPTVYLQGANWSKLEATFLVIVTF